MTRAVVTGQLRAGDAFPSVRALSQELRINPNTAHKIVATLVDERVLVVRPGIGTVVGDGAGQSSGDPNGLDEEFERLVIKSRRAGLSLHDVLAAIRAQWSKTSMRRRDA